jgi:hypothetical protein
MSFTNRFTLITVTSAVAFSLASGRVADGFRRISHARLVSSLTPYLG